MRPNKNLPLVLILGLAILLALFGGKGLLPDSGTLASPSPAITKAPPTPTSTAKAEDLPAIDEQGSYTSAQDVAAYLRLYERLPGNFITKAQARDLGWIGGDLRPYAPGKAIGGDRFGNFEGLLPTAPERQYYECDIDTLGAKSRGAKRLVYSNDGLIFYSEDHYESFVSLDAPS